MKTNKDYKHGDLVWFLKSMRICKFIAYDGGKTCTVERVDTGKRMTAMIDGISLTKEHHE